MPIDDVLLLLVGSLLGISAPLVVCFFWEWRASKANAHANAEGPKQWYAR